MPDLGPLAELLAPVLRDVIAPVVRGLLRTTLGVIALALLVAIGCFVIAADGRPWHGAAGAAIGLATCGVLGVMLALKRAALAAARASVAKASLGQRALGLLVERMLRVNELEQHGDRGVTAAQTAERVPLAQAERRLRIAVEQLTKASDAGDGVRGWLRRRASETLLSRVELLTLSALRTEGASAGGVDLIRVRDTLGPKIDERVVAGIDSALFRVTALVVLLACTVSVTAAIVIRFAT